MPIYKIKDKETGKVYTIRDKQTSTGVIDPSTLPEGNLEPRKDAIQDRIKRAATAAATLNSPVKAFFDRSVDPTLQRQETLKNVGGDLLGFSEFAGNQFDRANAPIRNLIRGQGIEGAKEGFLNPQDSPAFVQTLGKRGYDIAGVPGAIVAGGAGLVADVATSPYTAVGKVLQMVSRASNIGKPLSASKNLSFGNKLRVAKVNAKKAVNSLDDSYAVFTKQLDDVAAETSKTIQTRLPELSKHASEQYGKRLDDIIDNIPFQKRNISKDDIVSALDNTLYSASEGGINASPMTKFISKKIDDISDNGMDVKDFIALRREIRSKLPKSASRKSMPDDYVYAKFNEEFSNILENIDETFKVDFADLNSGYKESMKFMNSAYSKYKPFAKDSFFASPQGKSLVSKYVKGEADTIERDFFRVLGGGDNRFVKGIGDVTSDAQDIADVVKVLAQNDPRVAGSAADAIRANIVVMEQELNKLGKLKLTESLRKNARAVEKTAEKINKLERNKKLSMDIVDRIAVGTAIYQGAKAIRGATGEE